MKHFLECQHALSSRTYVQTFSHVMFDVICHHFRVLAHDHCILSCVGGTFLKFYAWISCWRGPTQRERGIHVGIQPGEGGPMGPPSLPLHHWINKHLSQLSTFSGNSVLNKMPICRCPCTEIRHNVHVFVWRKARMHALHDNPWIAQCKRHKARTCAKHGLA